MLHHFARILLQRAPDGGGGGGTPPAGQPPAGTPPAPAAPTAPGAQGTTAAEEPPAWFGPAIQRWGEQFGNSVYANTRRMMEGIVAKGQAGASASAPPPAASGTAPAAPTSASMSMSDLHRELDRDREFTRAIARVSLTEGQFGLMQRMFQLERPDDPSEWAKAFLASSGFGTPPSAPGAAPPPTGPQRPPASDAGAPAGPARDLTGVSLFGMSEADREHFIREKGIDAYRKLLIEQSRGVNVKLR